MPSDASITMAIAVMTAVVFGTRVAGAIFMSWIAPSAKIERFLDGLAVSVIAALVASLLTAGDVKLTVSVVLAIVVMALSRSVVWAMLTGMLSAAVYQQVVVP